MICVHCTRGLDRCRSTATTTLTLSCEEARLLVANLDGIVRERRSAHPRAIERIAERLRPTVVTAREMLRAALIVSLAGSPR